MYTCAQDCGQKLWSKNTSTGMLTKKLRVIYEIMLYSYVAVPNLHYPPKIELPHDIIILY